MELDDNGYPRHVRFDPIADYRGETFRDWAKGALDLGAHLVTESCARFNTAGAEVAAHGAIVLGKGKSGELEAFRWINMFISNVKPWKRSPALKHDRPPAQPVASAR